LPPGQHTRIVWDRNMWSLIWQSCHMLLPLRLGVSGHKIFLSSQIFFPLTPTFIDLATAFFFFFAELQNCGYLAATPNINFARQIYWWSLQGCKFADTFVARSQLLKLSRRYTLPAVYHSLSAFLTRDNTYETWQTRLCPIRPERRPTITWRRHATLWFHGPNSPCRYLAVKSPDSGR